MESLDDIENQLTGIIAGLGIDLPLSDNSSEKKKVICFNRANGERICEELPSVDEVKCSGDLCSVYLPNIEKSNPVEQWADKYNLRAFLTNNDGVTMKSLSGAITRDDLRKLSEDIGMEFNIKEGAKLRKIKLGDIEPPSVCKVNPLSQECKSYIEDKNWYYLGWKGWVRANSFKEAIKQSKSKGNYDPKPNTNVTSTTNTKTSKEKILTTV